MKRRSFLKTLGVLSAAVMLPLQLTDFGRPYEQTATVTFSGGGDLPVGAILATEGDYPRTFRVVGVNGFTADLQEVGGP